MDWQTYEENVGGSRKVIVFPYFERHLAGKSGIGIDVGCGHGDLTKRIAHLTAGKLVGIDSDEKSIKGARVEPLDDIHFVQGDIAKNAIPALGVTFDYAFSNCCFCHLSDEQMYEVLMDLYSCMAEGAELIFLVPSIFWARQMYYDVRNVSSGITAVPRYGGRQFFRTPEWYVSALRRCGFDLAFYDEILIPEDDRLEPRYRSRSGEKFFSAFIAKRAKQLPNSESMQKAFDVAHDNRKLEIQLFWQRSLFFWGFVATALVGYVKTSSSHSGLSVIFSLFGFVCSVVWTAGNRGSKYWQEYWEEKVNFFQHYTTGNIFFDRNPKTPTMFDNFAARRLSVSKLTMALSDYMAFLWLALCLHALMGYLYPEPTDYLKPSVVLLVLLTLCYCLFFLRKSKSED